MNATTIGVDLAKNRFELAIADARHCIHRRERLSRSQFQRFLANHPQSLIVMESCGSAHHWTRTLGTLGHRAQILPAQYVRAYVKRNKTDSADAAALIEASRCAEIRCLPVKSVEHQLILQLHRMRSQWMGTRTARINQLRGCLREFGIVIVQGAERGLAKIREQLALADNGLPDALRPMIAEILQEIAELEQRASGAERQLKALTRDDPIVQLLLQTPGLGLLTATVDIQRLPSGRHLASWLGITARESSSGERRRLGRISKRGDVYLRTLLIAWLVPYSTPLSRAIGAADPLIACAHGRSALSGAVDVTKPLSRSPTNSLASCGRVGSTNVPSMETGAVPAP